MATHKTEQVSGRKANHEDQIGAIPEVKTTVVKRPTSSVKLSADQASRTLDENSEKGTSSTTIRPQSKVSTFEVSGRRGQTDGQRGQTDGQRGQRDGQRGHADDTVSTSTVDAQSDVSNSQYQHETPQHEVSGRIAKYDDLAAGSDNLYTTLTLKHSLDLKTESDNYTCDITGLVVLQDKLIVCDNNNNKLKLYDLSNRFLSEFKCDDEPYDIAMLDTNTVAVSSALGHNMALLSVGNDRIQKRGKISIRKFLGSISCYGVCCYEGQIYCVVSDMKNLETLSEVRVYTPNGKLRHTFKHLYEDKVKCTNLDYITIDPQTGVLYVTDRYKNAVLAMSTSGEVIAVMATPYLKYPQGIAVDDHNQVFICGHESHNLIQMSTNGDNVVIILSGKEKCYWTQCVKTCGNKLFLSHLVPGSGNDKISIYQLS